MGTAEYAKNALDGQPRKSDQKGIRLFQEAIVTWLGHLALWQCRMIPPVQDPPLWAEMLARPLPPNLQNRKGKRSSEQKEQKPMKRRKKLQFHPSALRSLIPTSQEKAYRNAKTLNS